MKNSILKLCASALFVSTLFVSCNKESVQPVTTSYLSVEDATRGLKLIDMDGMTPIHVEPIDQYSVKVEFLQSARPYSLDLRLQNSQDLLGKIKKAIAENSPLSIAVPENSTSIVKVNPPSVTALLDYQESLKYDPKASVRAMTVVSSEAELMKLFNYLKNQPIPFKYIADGCYARAHKMRQLMLQKGIECKKQFVYGSLRAFNGYCCTSWVYHVAPLVKVKTSNGRVVEKIIDPSMFQEPVAPETWRNACINSQNCKGPVNITEYVNTDGAVYYYNNYSKTSVYDNDYRKTNDVIRDYTGLEGCGNTSYYY